MSWSVTFIGESENIIKALNDYSTKLNGPSKEEFDHALPHLIGLVQLNFNKAYPAVLKLNANGHAFSNSDGPQYSSCGASIETIGTGVLV